MLNVKDIIVFDFETTGLNPNEHEVIEVAGKAYNFKTLEPYENGEFVSLMKPLREETIDAKALEVNNKTIDELRKAPDPKIVWSKFVKWVGNYNLKGTNWTAPICAGKNIRSFDLLFVDVLNKKYFTKDPVLFDKRTQLDLEDHLFNFFSDSNEELPNHKMDTVREKFKLSKEGAHSALVDVIQTGDLLMRFLKIYRNLKRMRAKNGKPFINFFGE